MAESGTASFGEFNNGAETAVAGAAVSVLTANSLRRACLIQNTGAANVRVGIAGVTATTGVQLAPGAILILDQPFLPLGPVFAIREGGTSSTVFAMEISAPLGA